MKQEDPSHKDFQDLLNYLALNTCMINNHEGDFAKFKDNVLENGEHSDSAENIFRGFKGDSIDLFYQFVCEGAGMSFTDFFLNISKKFHSTPCFYQPNGFFKNVFSQDISNYFKIQLKEIKCDKGIKSDETISIIKKKKDKYLKSFIPELFKTIEPELKLEEEDCNLFFQFFFRLQKILSIIESVYTGRINIDEDECEKYCKPLETILLRFGFNYPIPEKPKENCSFNGLELSLPLPPIFKEEIGKLLELEVLIEKEYPMFFKNISKDYFSRFNEVIFSFLEEQIMELRELFKKERKYNYDLYFFFYIWNLSNISQIVTDQQDRNKIMEEISIHLNRFFDQYDFQNIIKRFSNIPNKYMFPDVDVSAFQSRTFRPDILLNFGQRQIFIEFDEDLNHHHNNGKDNEKDNEKYNEKNKEKYKEKNSFYNYLIEHNIASVIRIQYGKGKRFIHPKPINNHIFKIDGSNVSLINNSLQSHKFHECILWDYECPSQKQIFEQIETVKNNTLKGYCYCSLITILPFNEDDDPPLFDIEIIKKDLFPHLDHKHPLSIHNEESYKYMEKPKKSNKQQKKGKTNSRRECPSSLSDED